MYTLVKLVVPVSINMLIILIWMSQIFTITYKTISILPFRHNDPRQLPPSIVIPATPEI